MNLARAVTLAGLATLAATAEAAPLRSPWDRKPVTLKDSGYSCPNIAPLPKDIDASSFYNDEQHSKIDPKLKAKYDAAQEQFRGIAAQSIDAAEKFRSSGSRDAAACVLKILDTEADAAAMTGSMSSNQAYYVQNWTIGALAVTWLKVRQADPGTPEDRAKAIAWMTKVAHSTEDYFTARHLKGTNDGTNNHFYWAGFAVMSVGIAADDRGLFDWGVSTYNEAMSRIQPDGLDLYNANNGALRRLINVTASGLIDNSLFTVQAKVTQDTPEKSGLKSEDVIWLVPYLSHYPDANLSRVLHSATLKPFGYLGGYPPG